MKIDTLTGNEELKRLCDKLLYHFKYRNSEAKVIEMFILFFKVGKMLKTLD
jgi:hypothetical protein